MNIKIQQIVMPFLNAFITVRIGIVLLFLFSQSVLYGQSDAQKTFFKIKLQDKTKFYGELLYKTKDSLILRHSNGTFYPLHRSAIKRFVKLNNGYIRKGKFYPAIVNYDEGYGAPTGFGLKKGEVYYENTMAGWNEISAGLTDYFSLKVGFDNFFFFRFLTDNVGSNEFYNPVVFLSAKLAKPIIKDKWNIALTSAVLHLPTDEAYFDFGYLFLSNTFGNKNNNFTIGLGTDIFRSYNAPEISFITFSCALRLGRKLSLISENWVILDHGYDKIYEERTALNSFGIKILGNHVTTSITVIRFNDPSSNNSDFLGAALVSMAIPISWDWRS